MMTKTTSSTKALFLQWVITPVITGIALCFTLKTVAQDPAFKSSPRTQIKEYTVEGASPALMKEFADIVNAHKTITKKGFTTFAGFSKEQRKRLEEIYKVMSRVQQKESVVAFLPRDKPFSKIVPSAKQLEDFSNPKNYGVWIDGKKVSNSILNNYQAADFSHVFISRLYGYARSGKIYNYQVDLMTNSYYKDYYERAKNDTGYVMLITFEKEKAPALMP